VSEEIIHKGEKLYRLVLLRGGATRPSSTAAVPGRRRRNPRFALRPAQVHKDWYGIVLVAATGRMACQGLADPPKFAFPKAR